MQSKETNCLPQIVKSSDISLTDLQTSLIQNIHCDYAKVILEKEFGGGFSGTRVFLVLPVHSNDVSDARMVTKIGPVDELRLEKESSQRISRAIPFSATQVREYYEQDGWAALNYVFAGGESLGKTMSLEEFYHARPEEEVIKSLTELLCTVLGPNLYQKASPLTCTFRDEYGRHLPAPEQLRSTVLALFPGLLGIDNEKVTIQTIGTFTNPLKAYPGVLDRTLEGRRSLVHGDLHLRNVLVDQTGKSWLIDFAKVGERHNLFDFIKLEVYVRLMALAPRQDDFSLREYVEFEQALNASSLGYAAKAPSNAELRFAYNTILAIRRIAVDSMGNRRGFKEEYLPALSLYTLAMLKYYPTNGDAPTRLLFISACVLMSEPIQTQLNSPGFQLDFDTIVSDYENSFDSFFDQKHGAAVEYERENGIPRFIYTEATAYAIKDCLLLYTLTGRQKYIERAVKCAQWILFAQDPVGGVRTRYFFEENDKDTRYTSTSFAGRQIYSFDTAACIEALVALYLHTNDTSLLAGAIKMGDFLLEKMISEEGHVVAVYDARVDQPGDTAIEWSKQFGAFHSKVALALTVLSSVDNERKARYIETANRICRTLIEKKFSGEGYFETSPNRIALHPLAYAAEGLFYVGLQLNSNKYISVARSVVVWLLKLLDRYPDGEFPQIFNSRDFAPLPNAKFRTDALAQIVGLAADMHRRGHLDKIDFDKSEVLVQKILEMKADGTYFRKDKELKFFRYGYYYHERDTSKNGEEAKTLSSWTNMFCFQSLFKHHLTRILDETVVIVLAGGKGTRFWPLSCETRPKPLSKSILGDRSLLQETIRRYTFNSFIAPDNIYIITNETSLAETYIQANEIGIPESNVIMDAGKEDSSIRAVSCGLERIPAHPSGSRLIIVSMADNIFEPYDAFQSALTTALLLAHSKPSIVSIGQPVDLPSDKDPRFGHMLYSTADQIGPYRACSVSFFKEKPNESEWSDLLDRPGHWAWECGTPVFREQYFIEVLRKFFPNCSPLEGKLADDLLAKATLNGDENGIHLIVALLPSGAKFDDFGVPGKNVFSYFKRGENANVFLGPDPKVRALCCQGNLVITDELPVQLYGLKDYLIVDSAVANSTVVMPLERASDLDEFYKSLSAQRMSKAFIRGGKVAKSEQPFRLASNCGHQSAHASASFGCAVLSRCDENISLHRTRDGIVINNQDYPTLLDKDFDSLIAKEQQEPMIVRHLLDVSMLAEVLLTPGKIALTNDAKWLLGRLCLYHDYGGYLSKQGVEEEEEHIRYIKSITKVDRRLVDSRVLKELIESVSSASAKESSWLYNDHINSAVELLRLKYTYINNDTRDILVFLLQGQEPPEQYNLFRSGYSEQAFDLPLHEIDSVFAVFKLAEIIANGKWAWKRQTTSLLEGNSLSRTQGQKIVEDFPEIIDYSMNWLKRAGIGPRLYIESFNQLIATNEGPFADAIKRLQGDIPTLVSDRIYKSLLTGTPASIRSVLEEELNSSLPILEEQPFQREQLKGLPGLLEKIKGVGSIPALSSDDDLKAVKKVIEDFLHKHYSLFF